jgi:methionine-rich copper-binding protein CopC
MMISLRALVRVSFAFALVAGATTLGAATFHAHLKKSVPAAGDTLTASPREVRLWFTEKPELVGSSVTVKDAAGGTVALGKLHADSADAMQLVASITTPLSPGAYSLAWRTMGADGHPVRGSFAFVMRAAKSGAAKE